MTYQITNQRALRRAFWEAHKSTPTVSRHKQVRNSGDGYRYNTDTRCAWCDWIDMLSKDGTISQELAQRATLD